MRAVDLAGVQVVPVEHDRCRARGHGGREDLGLVEDALGVQLLEEVDAGLDVVGRPAVGQGGRPDRLEGRVGAGRVAVERDLSLVGGIVQLLDRRRAGLDLRGVAPDRDVAAVVAEPQAAGVLQGVRDVVPRRDLVGREQPALRAVEGVGVADVDDVRRAGLALRRLQGVDLVTARAVGVLADHLDPVLLLEAGDDGGVVRPRRRQGDHVERALLLGRGDEGAHPAPGRRRLRLGPVGRLGRRARPALRAAGLAPAVRRSAAAARRHQRGSSRCRQSHCQPLRAHGSPSQKVRWPDDRPAAPTLASIPEDSPAWE